MRSQLFSLATLVFVGAITIFGTANQAHALTIKADTAEIPKEYLLVDKCGKKGRKKTSRYDLNGDGVETSGEIFEGSIDEVNSVLQEVLNATKNDPVIRSEFDRKYCEKQQEGIEKKKEALKK